MSVSLLAALTTGGFAAGEIESEIRKLKMKPRKALGGKALGGKALGGNAAANRQAKQAKAAKDAKAKAGAARETNSVKRVMSKSEAELNKYLNY